jgi:ribose transport system ATP-binding protein
LIKKNPRRHRAVHQRLGLKFPRARGWTGLSIAQQQMVEIAKALSLNARLIIMDEPTSSLTLTETNRLLELVCELSEQGVSIIYISHRLGEIDECADRVVVLRDGKNAGELTHEEATHDKLVNLMVGREIKSFYVQSRCAQTPGFFKVRNASSSLHPGKNVSFDAARGEILGLPDSSARAVRKWPRRFRPRSSPQKGNFLDGKKLSINRARRD